MFYHIVFQFSIVPLFFSCLWDIVIGHNKRYFENQIITIAVNVFLCQTTLRRGFDGSMSAHILSNFLSWYNNWDFFFYLLKVLINIAEVFLLCLMIVSLSFWYACTQLINISSLRIRNRRIIESLVHYRSQEVFIAVRQWCMRLCLWLAVLYVSSNVIWVLWQA